MRAWPIISTRTRISGMYSIYSIGWWQLKGQFLDGAPYYGWQVPRSPVPQLPARIRCVPDDVLLPNGGWPLPQRTHVLPIVIILHARTHYVGKYQSCMF